jgi:hypothetical protein
MFDKTFRLFLLLGLLIAFGCGGEDTTTNPPPGPMSATLDASMDNTLYEDATGQWSNGMGDFMFVGKTLDLNNGGQSGEPAEIRRALIGFDIAGSSIPATATVDSVFLVVYMQQTKSTIVRTVSLHRVTNTWGESTSDPLGAAEGGGDASDVGDATWIHRFFATLNWATPGGDYVAGASGTKMVGTTIGGYKFGSTAQMVADVQGWLNGTTPNNGWILIGDESTDGTATKFHTRNSSVAGNRPKLVVFYTP